MGNKAYLFLADGFETIEALTPVDVLRRCGIEVATVSITDNKCVRSSHGIQVEADTTLAACDMSDSHTLIVPGGYPGYVNLQNSSKVGELLKRHYDNGGVIAAICAGPTLLEVNGIATGKRITCHSSVRSLMSVHYTLSDTGVEQDGNIITAAGAGHSIAFALAIANAMTDRKKVAETERKMEL